MQDIIREDKKYKLKRPLTGVIHKDRIWEQWYDPRVFDQKLPKMNQKTYAFDVCNKDYKSQTILNNRGLKSMTIGELENLISQIEYGLVAQGIGEGDIVATIGLSTPELIAIKYAAGDIGAITTNLNFLDKPEQLYKKLKKVNPSVIFTLDIVENKVNEIINLPEFATSKKVRLPLSHTTPILNGQRYQIALLTLINQLKNKDIKNMISFSQFLQNGKKYKNQTGQIIESVYRPHMPANIAFTSGTTGDNKGVLLSHDANNALAFQHQAANLGLNRGNKNLALVPPFLAIWDADIIHMAICSGIENILELSLTYENIPKYMEKYKPNYGIWSQFLWDSLLTMDKDKQAEVVKYLDKCVVGGERAEINQVVRFYIETGILQVPGYGATEVNSCFSVAHPNCNVIGSAGLPLPFNNVRIVDSEMNDLTYNQNGRILITGPAMMEGYYKRNDLTKKVLIQDSDGVVWYDTNDYGHVDITGSIVPLDRDSNPIVIHSGEKVKLQDVAEDVKKCPEVKMCKVNSYSGYIVSHVILDDFSEKSINEQVHNLLDTCNGLSLEQQPHIINILSTLPRTQVGKVDYPELDKMTADLVLGNLDKLQQDSRLNVVGLENLNVKTMGKHI